MPAEFPVTIPAKALRTASGGIVPPVGCMYQWVPESFFRPATHTALVMNTTDDLGYSGPGCTCSWGAISVDTAGQFIRQHAENSLLRVLVENLPRPGQTCPKAYARDGSGLSLVSLAWLDPSGPVVSRNDRWTRLVNDFEMSIIHYPCPEESVDLTSLMLVVNGLEKRPETVVGEILACDVALFSS